MSNLEKLVEEKQSWKASNLYPICLSHLGNRYPIWPFGTVDPKQLAKYEKSLAKEDIKEFEPALF